LLGNKEHPSIVQVAEIGMQVVAARIGKPEISFQGADGLELADRGLQLELTRRKCSSKVQGHNCEVACCSAYKPCWEFTQGGADNT
jgi:hypothetical protein